MTSMLTTAQHSGRSEKDRLIEGEQILADKALGVRLSDIMTKYGLSKATVHRRIDEAVKARLAVTVDAYREQQNALLDDMAVKWQGQINMGEELFRQGTLTENMIMIDRGVDIRERGLVGLLRVVERRSKLNGLDAPVRVDAVIVHHDAKDLELAEMVSGRKREPATAV